MATLYELAEQYKGLIDYSNDILDTEDGNDEEILAMLIDTLEGIEDSLEVKIENISKLLKNLNADAAAYEEEKKRLAKKEKSIKNQIDRLKKYTQDMMTIAGKESIKTGIVSVRLQRNPPSVSIIDPSRIPEKFREKQEDKILTNEILKALKAETQVDGAVLAPESKHIRFS